MSEQQTNKDPSSQREIAIFWDYENVPLPSCCNATQAAKAIVDTVSPYGRIVDRRLYCGNSQPRDCSSLDSSGFDLVVTPTRNQKESLDKKMIVDVLSFAWDSAVRNDNTKPCVVLLTGDGDYAYTLSKLRDRGIFTIVMVGRECTVASILVETADVAMSLEDDVLCSIDTTKKILPPSPSSKPSTPTNMTGPDDTNMLIICRSIQNLTSTSENRDDWWDYGPVAMILQKTIRQNNPDRSPDYVKQQARIARQKAESNGFIELGRRKLETNGFQREIVPWDSENRSKLSPEVYARLLPKGEQLLQGYTTFGTSTAAQKQNIRTTSPIEDKNNKTRTLFIRNLPLRTDIRDFVAVLQKTFNVIVSRARLDYPKASSICNALVEFKDEADAVVVLQCANKATGGKGLSYEGQFVGAVPNTRYNPFSGASKYTSSKSYYESGESPRSVTLQQTQDHKTDITQYDAADDIKIFCRAVDLAGQQRGVSDDWINAGSVGAFFRSLLPSSYLKAALKEDVNLRFKDARGKAIEDGLVEMGRRKLQSSGGEDEDAHSYVPVALDRIGGRNMTGCKLSSELYFRLLFSGKAIADEFPSEIAVLSSHKSPSSNKCIFMNNLPRSTTAAQLVQYLETMECPAQRVVLEDKIFKGVPATSAHIECVHAEDATRIIRQAKAYDVGLVYCGRRIYATSNRTTPDGIVSTTSSSNPEMSYTREETTSPLGITVQTEDTDMTESSSLDIIASGSDELVQLVDTNNDNNSNNIIIMRQDSVQKDPFEDLLWMT